MDVGSGHLHAWRPCGIDWGLCTAMLACSSPAQVVEFQTVCRGKLTLSQVPLHQNLHGEAWRGCLGLTSIRNSEFLSKYSWTVIAQARDRQRSLHGRWGTAVSGASHRTGQVGPAPNFPLGFWCTGFNPQAPKASADGGTTGDTIRHRLSADDETADNIARHRL